MEVTARCVNGPGWSRRYRQSRLASPPVAGLQQLANGQLLVESLGGGLSIWDSRTPAGRVLPIPTAQLGVPSLLALRNGDLLAGGYDGKLRRWRDGEPQGMPIPVVQPNSDWRMARLPNGDLVSNNGRSSFIRRLVPAGVGRRGLPTVAGAAGAAGPAEGGAADGRPALRPGASEAKHPQQQQHQGAACQTLKQSVQPLDLLGDIGFAVRCLPLGRSDGYSSRTAQTERQPPDRHACTANQGS